MIGRRRRQRLERRERLRAAELELVLATERHNDALREHSAACDAFERGEGSYAETWRLYERTGETYRERIAAVRAVRRLL